MNWVNIGFYAVTMITGLCYFALKIKLIRGIMPAWLSTLCVWVADLFWIILFIFAFRSLLWEPFRIPSASMMPTLEAGDFILVNKYIYGAKMPGAPFKFTEGNKPQKGEVVVFRYPQNPSLDYIKRVVAVPGDIIEYRGTPSLDVDATRLLVDKVLKVNGEVITKKLYVDTAKLSPENRLDGYQVFEEKLGDVEHLIRERIDMPVIRTQTSSVEAATLCDYDLPERFRCTVPEGRYFVMGDNRDESEDSRYWGFVPAENMVGRAFFVWMNFWKFERLGAIR